MIRAVLMLVEPARTWEKIKIAQAGVGRLTFTLVLPLLLLSVVVESLGLMQLGMERGALGLTLAPSIKFDPRMSKFFGVYVRKILPGSISRTTGFSSARTN